MIDKSGDGKPVLVIGAGIVGMASACFLQREGFNVAVIDPDP
ncbi:MAG: FAD-dependent oxidoreductase, partial [Hyphomicrobiales bacterium]